MPTTTFHIPLNDASSHVAAPRAVGAPVVVTAGTGALFGSAFPLLLTVTRGVYGTFVAELEATGRTGDTLTISGPVEGAADAELLVGDLIECRPSALALAEVHGAVHALEAAASPLPDASAATPAIYLGSDHSGTPCFKDPAGGIYLLPYVAAPAVPEAIPGLLAWWDASRGRYQDTPPTVPAGYGDRVRSIVSRDASAQVASTVDPARSLLAVGGGFDGGSGPGLYGDASVDFNTPALSAATTLTRPYTLVVVGTEGTGAEIFRYHYAGKDANSSPYNYITCETDASGQVVISNAPVMDQSVRMAALHRHVWVVRCDVTGSSVWVDGVDRTTGRTPTSDWGAINFGGRSGTEGHVLAYDRALSDAEVASLSSYLGRATLNLIADGNSLTIGTDSAAGPVATGAWPYLLANAWAATDPLIRVANVAVSGRTTAQRDAAAAATADTHFDPAAGHNVLVMWELTNSQYFGATAAQAYADYATYAANRKAAHPAGLKVVLCDMIDRYNVARGPVNALVAADFAVPTADPYTWLPAAGVTYADMLIRLGSIPALSDWTDTTYFGADGTHLTPAGYALVAAQVEASLTVLTGGPIAPAPDGPAIPRSRVTGLTADLSAKAGTGAGKFVFELPQGSAAVGTDQAPTYPTVPVACSCSKVWVSAKIAPTGASLILDILKSSNNGTTWTSLWASTPADRPTLAAGANNGSTASFDTAALSAGDWLRIDVAQVGSTAAGSGVAAVLATI